MVRSVREALVLLMTAGVIVGVVLAAWAVRSENSTSVANAHPTTAAGDSSRAQAAWEQAQAAFLTAVQQAPILGSAATGVDEHWSVFRASLAAYMQTSAAWQDTPRQLDRILNRAPGDIGYAVQDWAAPVSTLRFVLVSQGARPAGSAVNSLHDLYVNMWRPNYNALLLAWRNPSGVVRTQFLWWAHRFSTQSSVMATDDTVEALPTGVHAWHARDGSWRLALTMTFSGGGSGGDSPVLLGLRLEPGSASWLLDAAMFPRDPLNDLKVAGYDTASFINSSGSIIIVHAYVSTLFKEGNCCMYAEAVRLLQLTGNVYVPGTWALVPSPYDTLVELATLGTSSDSVSCSDYAHVSVSMRLATLLCTVAWNTPRIVGEPNWRDATARRRPITATVSPDINSNKRLTLTITPVHGVWLVSSAHLWG